MDERTPAHRQHISEQLNSVSCRPHSLPTALRPTPSSTPSLPPPFSPPLSPLSILPSLPIPLHNAFLIVTNNNVPDARVGL